MSAMNDEFRRRMKVAASGVTEDQTGVPSDMPHRPFRNPKYQHVVINFGNQALPPRTTDGRAAFRVLGGFPSPAQARAHCARRLGVHAKEAFTAVVETHKWYVVPHSVERIPTAAPHLEDLLRWHEESMESRQAFQERIAAEREALEQRQQQEEEENDDGEEEGGETKTRSIEPPQTPVCSPNMEPAASVPVDVEPSSLEEPFTDSMVVRGQHLAIVSFLHDRPNPEGYDEPAVCVWGFAADQDEAEKMMRCVIGYEIKNHDLVAVEMYEWIAPHVASKRSNEIRTTYRNAEENNIMQGLFNSRQHSHDPRLRSARAITITPTAVHLDEQDHKGEEEEGEGAKKE